VARTGNNALVFRAMEWRDPIRGTAEDPYFVTLDAIGKKNEEGTASVAVEFLCNRLALMVGLPVPPGALVQTTEGNPAFVSLRFGSLTELPTRVAPDEFVQDNPRMAAGISVFDLLILNHDRNTGNLAYIKDEQAPAIIDHGRALGASDRFATLNASQSAMIRSHCLHKYLSSGDDLARWIDRLRRLDIEVVREHIDALVALRLLTASEGRGLLGFLRFRLDQLEHLVQLWLPAVERGLL
jgi:hypothetical protein